jgi:hypothetical protein
MPSEKLTRILQSKSPFSEQEISQMAEIDGWQWVYKNKKPKNGKPREICFTGFPDSEKSDLAKLATEAGLTVVGSVTRNLWFLCKGQNPGPAKIEKGTSQGVLIVSLDEFRKILESGELPERELGQSQPWRNPGMKALIAGAIIGLLSMGTSAQTRIGAQSVFGFSLGEKLAMPECPFDTQNKFYVDDSRVAAFEGKALSKTTCFEHWDNALAGQPAGTERVGIKFPEGESPSIAAGVSALLIDGRLESVSIDTAGLSNQDQVMAALKQKYGAPTSTNETKKQNSFGAVFNSHFAVWKFANLTVVFKGTTSHIDSGLVNIETKKGADYRSALSKQSHDGPKL